MRIRTVAGVGLCGVVVFGIIVCGFGGDAHEISPAARPRSGHEIVVGGKPVDLAAVMERTHFAFRDRGDALTGGDDSYAVDVRGSTFSVRPVGGTSAAPLQLTTTQVGTAVSRDRTFTREDDGHVSREIGDGVVEHLRTGHTGVEQSWELAHAPEGDGDLVVRVAATGEQFDRRSGAGLRFIDSATGATTVYSDARFVDASGAQTPIQAELDDGDIVMRVPHAVVAAAAYPAVLDPTIGSEIAAQAGALNGAHDEQSYPALGHSGAINREFLVVWQDTRRGLAGKHDIYGAHVDRNGMVLEPMGFLVSDPQNGKDHTTPSIYFDATSQLYLVAYAEDNAIVGRALTTAANAPLGATIPIVNAIAGTTITNLDIAWDLFADNTSHFGIVWEADTGGVPQVHAATGTLAVSGGTASFTTLAASAIGPLGASTPRIANSTREIYGTKFLVVWELAGNIQGVMLDEHFGISPTFTIQQSNAQDSYISRPSVGFFGSPSPSWLVASSVYSNAANGYYKIIATEVDTNGVVYNTAVVDQGTHDHFWPSVAGGGIDNLGHALAAVSWADFSYHTDNFGNVRSSQVEINGHFLSVLSNSVPFEWGAVTRASGANGHPIASHSDEIDHFLIANSPTGDDADIVALRYEFGSTVVNAIRVSGSYSKQTAPAIAWCGGRYLAVWDDRIAFPWHGLLGTMFDSSGNVLVPKVVIAPLTVESHPSVACNGTNFSVAWDDLGPSSTINIYSALVKPDGSVAGGVALTTTGTNQHPALTASSDGTWVVWDTQDSIYAQRLDDKSQPLGARVLIDSQPRPIDTAPDIAADLDTHTLQVVYQRAFDIYSVALSSTGIVGSTFAIETNTAAQRAPRIRWTGKGYLIAYEDDRNIDKFGTDIYARTLSENGIVGPAFVVASTNDDDLRPRLAGRDVGSVDVVYARRSRSQAFFADVYGQTVKDGLLSGAAYPITKSTTALEIEPDLACAKPTACLAVYRAFDLVSTNAYRVMARTVTY